MKNVWEVIFTIVKEFTLSFFPIITNIIKKFRDWLKHLINGGMLSKNLFRNFKLKKGEKLVITFIIYERGIVNFSMYPINLN